MKKLMFAAAIAASAAAFADPINAIGFAGYDLGATFTNGQAEKDENGDTKTAATYGYFCFYGESDSSVVTNDNPSTTKHTAAFATAEDTKYLALDTEGGTLWRSINTLTRYPIDENNAVYSNGTAQAVASTGTYLDTLVQFTVTEDEAPTLGDDDKLAIWLQAGEGETNLMVKAKGWALDSGSPTAVATSFTVNNVAVEPGTWYRLTVKAIQTVIDPTTGMIIPAFQIFIDGTEVAATTPQISTEMQGAFTGNNVWIEGMAALASANKLFPSLAEIPAALTDVTLQGVGFQGTGAVDEIVWTEDNPFSAASTVAFTLTWGEGVSAVSYTLLTDLTTTNSLTSGTAVQLAPGDGTAMIELIPTFTTGYEFDKVTMGETDLSLTFAIPGVTTNATLLAKAAAPAYPTYLTDADATIKGKYDAWKQTYQADTESAWENAFLLNMDPTASVAEGTALLKIASITEVSGGWELEIASDATTLTAETNNDGLVGNGYLAITYAADLATLTSGGTTVNLPVTVTNGKIKVTVTAPGAKFMKAKLTTAAETVAGE